MRASDGFFGFFFGDDNRARKSIFRSLAAKISNQCEYFPRFQPYRLSNGTKNGLVSLRSSTREIRFLALATKGRDTSYCI